MPLKNYSTRVPAEKTTQEIMAILAIKGAREILAEYDDTGAVEGLSFRIDTPSGRLPFRLPVNLHGVRQRLAQEWEAGSVRLGRTTEDHVRRVDWRIMKDWLEAQMALLDTEMVELEQIFLPYMIVGGERNLYEYMLAGGFQQIALNSGRPPNGS